ncbi:MAG TPA: hypothetical protein VF988_03405 [Verrucomicrobiae bacterium]
MPSADSPVLEWLGFIAFLILLSIALGAFFVWQRLRKRPESKFRKGKHRHHHHSNPTLAQAGGLPPKRDPNTPPPGP